MMKDCISLTMMLGGAVICHAFCRADDTSDQKKTTTSPQVLFDRYVTWLTLTPDGQRLNSGHADSTLLVTDVAAPGAPAPENVAAAWRYCKTSPAPLPESCWKRSPEERRRRG